MSVLKHRRYRKRWLHGYGYIAYAPVDARVEPDPECPGLGSYKVAVRDRGISRQRDLVFLAEWMAFEVRSRGLRQPKVKRGQRR